MSRSVQAFWVALSSLSSILVSLLSVAVLARYLDKESIGSFRQISLVYATLSVFFLGGLPAAFSYYLPRITPGQGKSFVLRATAALFVLGMLLGATIFAFRETISFALGNSSLNEALALFAIIPIFLFPCLGFESILTAYGQARLLAIFTVFSRALTFTLMVAPVVFFEGGLLEALKGWGFASAISLFGAAGVLFAIFRTEKLESTGVSLRQIFAYSSPLVAAGLFGSLFKAADQYFVGKFYGVEQYAVYATAMIEIPFVAMITASISAVLLPAFSKMHSDGAPSAAFFGIWRSVLSKSALVVYPIVSFCMIFADEIIHLLFGESYVSGANYFRAGMLVNFFNVVAFAPLILAIGETGRYAIAHLIIAAIAWGGGYIVVMTSPELAVFALFFVVTKIFLVGYFVWFLSRFFSVAMGDLFPWKRMAGVALVLLMAASMSWLISGAVGGENHFSRLLVGGASYALLLLAFGKRLGYDFIAPISPIISSLRGRG